MHQIDIVSVIEQVPIQKLEWPLLKKAGIDLWIRRDDLLDAQLSGNKFYKLWFNLEEARCKGFRRLLSFGGAWSNHIHALAAAGQRFGFETIGLIRGEMHQQLNPCLADAKAWGMELHYLTREEYGLRYAPEFQADLAQRYDAMVIPEGGANLAGAAGMQALGKWLTQNAEQQFTGICLASGTGTSLAGLAAGVDQSVPVYGFSVLKGDGDLAANVRAYYRQLNTQSVNKNLPENWRLISGFHAGGYAKKHPQWLRKFWQEFEQQTSVLLDPVYTLKLFWGIANLAQQGFWPRGSRLLAIHTGGLQGRRGFQSGI